MEITQENKKLSENNTQKLTEHNYVLVERLEKFSERFDKIPEEKQEGFLIGMKMLIALYDPGQKTV
jgi:acetylornithine/succinyldiaminopimelate/putrescine aminotransferase